MDYVIINDRKENMPSISLFYGILISMQFDDHNPPHFHAKYQDYKAVFSLEGDLLRGKMPQKQCNLIKAWCEIHVEDLRENWNLAQTSEDLFKIEPLR